MYRKGWLSSWSAPIPVIVVGNITVGGAGKTPLTLALLEHFQKEGFKPGVVSRGYGSQAPHYPFSVTARSAVQAAGDEPLLIAQRTDCPVVIDPDRSEACRFLLSKFNCDLIISDDGLQHYGLCRDIELLVVDSKRGFGNQQCLPVGPLREPLSRVSNSDYLIVNGDEGKSISFNIPDVNMQLKPIYFKQLATGNCVSVNEWSGDKRIHAVAGIGNPERFFKTLSDLGFDVIKHAFDDHHNYIPEDVKFDGRPVIMTEKDAVKIKRFNYKNTWYLHIDAVLSEGFLSELGERINAIALDKASHRERN
jgi:tetraacyldisaccharide 4'-kinase